MHINCIYIYTTYNFVCVYTYFTYEHYPLIRHRIPNLDLAMYLIMSRHTKAILRLASYTYIYTHKLYMYLCDVLNHATPYKRNITFSFLYVHIRA